MACLRHTFSKNRLGRFQESKVFEQLFEEIVTRCLEAGLVQGDNLSVDGSSWKPMLVRRAASLANS